MKRSAVFLFCLISFVSTIVNAKEVQEDIIPVIIDTDMGLDDARALSLLFNSNKLEIKGIITSDGASAPQAGYENIIQILEYLKKPVLPIGRGRTYGAPPWREKCNTLGWAIWPGSNNSEPEIPSSSEIILEILNNANSPIVYICIGPLTNLADVLKTDNFPLERIEKVLYFGTSPNSDAQSWNTRRDIDAARLVFSSSLPIWVFHPTPHQLIPFDTELYDSIDKINTNFARLIALTHKDKRVQRLFGTKHSMIWDEIIALYLFHPSLITGEYLATGNPVFRFKDWDKDQARELYLKVLSQRF